MRAIEMPSAAARSSTRRAWRRCGRSSMRPSSWTDAGAGRCREGLHARGARSPPGLGAGVKAALITGTWSGMDGEHAAEAVLGGARGDGRARPASSRKSGNSVSMAGLARGRGRDLAEAANDAVGEAELAVRVAIGHSAQLCREVLAAPGERQEALGRFHVARQRRHGERGFGGDRERWASSPGPASRSSLAERAGRAARRRQRNPASAARCRRARRP